MVRLYTPLFYQDPTSGQLGIKLNGKDGKEELIVFPNEPIDLINSNSSFEGHPLDLKVDLGSFQANESSIKFFYKHSDGSDTLALNAIGIGPNPEKNGGFTQLKMYCSPEQLEFLLIDGDESLQLDSCLRTQFVQIKPEEKINQANS